MNLSDMCQQIVDVNNSIYMYTKTKNMSVRKIDITLTS